MLPKEVELTLKYHTIGTNLEPVCTAYLNVPSELSTKGICFALFCLFPQAQNLEMHHTTMSEILE